jgi:uncharacterized membrane protein
VSTAYWLIATYLGLLLLQVVWHGCLPAPHGNQNWPLALLSTAPLLLPLRGILQQQMRSMTWGGYLLVVYFAVGIMETWSNPEQRTPAMVQVTLVLLYVACLVKLARGLR